MDTIENPTPEQLAAFLKDLTELSRKHGLYIFGCGCCESPSVEPADSGEGVGYQMDPSYTSRFIWVDKE